MWSGVIIIFALKVNILKTIIFKGKEKNVLYHFIVYASVSAYDLFHWLFSSTLLEI